MTQQNRKLLESLETKYIALLDVVGDIARIEMGNASQTNSLAAYIAEHQQNIQLKAQMLRGN